MAPHEQEEEDDYLAMTFEDPEPTPKNETLTQKRRRLAREAEERSRPKSKAQLAEEAEKKREAALNTSLDKNSKGFKMMAALGYEPGSALGKSPTAKAVNGDHRIREPIAVEMKEDRGGIGVESEKKRKFREQAEKQELSDKRVKVDALEYRERQQKEREEKRHEAQFWAAMTVADRLDDEDRAKAAVTQESRPQHRPLNTVNVFWRALVRQRLLKEQEQRQRQEFKKVFDRLPTLADADEDGDDKLALGKSTEVEDGDVELDQDDPELDAFLERPPNERLDKIVDYLRSHWHYCFWCKHQYDDEDMESCPGTGEDEHG